MADDKRKIATIDKLTVDERSLINLPVAVIRYQHDNHLGSASLELDATAQIISYEEYHPFGSTSYRSGKSETEVSLKRYKYVGKERDEETGLYYYGFRYYAPWIARFINVDPLQHEYPHYTPFQYAGNKPITYVDLDGLEEGIKDEEKSNFYIKQNDAVAKEDILNLVGENNKSKNYIQFSEDGKVTFTKAFKDLSEKDRKKILKKDEGLKLISDLIYAVDKEGKDVLTLYQTSGPFNFSGYKEGKALGMFPKVLPNYWPDHTVGEITSLDKDNMRQFSYVASVTPFGFYNGELQSTILPCSGFQSQVAIAPGDLEMVKTIMYTDFEETHNFNTRETIKKRIDTPVSTYSKDRSNLVKHELRESLFRSQSGKDYDSAHRATIKMYGDWEVLEFIWK